MGMLKKLRQRAGLSQQKLADKAGTSQPQINRLEHDDREMTGAWAVRLAPHINALPETLVFGNRSVPIVGKAEAGAGVKMFGDASDVLGRARMPTGGTPDTVAVEIDGESLGNGFNGWYAYYDHRHDPPSASLLGQMCVVGLASGHVLIKNLIKGRAEGRFDLWPVAGGTPLTDQDVAWAALVITILPPWLAKIEEFEDAAQPPTHAIAKKKKARVRYQAKKKRR